MHLKSFFDECVDEDIAAALRAHSVIDLLLLMNTIYDWDDVRDRVEFI